MTMQPQPISFTVTRPTHPTFTSHMRRGLLIHRQTGDRYFIACGFNGGFDVRLNGELLCHRDTREQALFAIESFAAWRMRLADPA